MISPETIEKIKELMAEASVYEEDLEESFILGGGPGGQKTQCGAHSRMQSNTGVDGTFFQCFLFIHKKTAIILIFFLFCIRIMVQ